MTDPGPATDPGMPGGEPVSAAAVLRFRRSERWVHWALAVPFVLLYATAIAMIALWAEPGPRPIRSAVGWTHRGVGLLLIALPLLALVRGRAEWRTHWRNLRDCWTWTRDDVRWLMLAARSAVDRRVVLPEAGKFNAGEKLNFIMVGVGYPLYAVTGLLLWAPGASFWPWVAHYAMAAIGIPLVLGHILMATVNPSTRPGLPGMIGGYVDGDWAKHHYPKWYREATAPPVTEVSAPDRPAEERSND